MIKNVALGLVFILYPFIIFFGLKWIEPSVLALILVSLTLLRIYVSKNKKAIPLVKVVGINAVLLLSLNIFVNSTILLKLYPVIINFSFLSVFIYSIFNPPAVITLIASSQEKLTENAVHYTRKVTLVWCVFFMVNGLIALWTVFQSDEYWTVYNGIISYILMGLLFTCEWLVRRNFKKNDQSNYIT
ncbi:hypothetical protein [Colwellia sp. E2M01]|uniref:COG4648 family protein n=1 Tax=Colwellia sp. E2M01 TaxID=2841561 RepID=UPI001C08E41F|nr:hypothetical protein [Colwellia sp. E2M01]MBU2871616.1 hypothetical protein [Colwellia sp. E2M01]